MTLDLPLLLRDGAILSVLASACVMAVMRVNPRLFLRYYPQAIREAAPPISKQERIVSRVVGAPYLALLIGLPVWSTMTFMQHHPGANYLSASVHGFGVAMAFNIIDFLIIDLLWFARFRPRWATIPGTEHVPFNFNTADHLRGFALGTIISLLVALLAALFSAR